MNKIIELSTWNRREHFKFFSKLDEPFHGLVANIDCSLAYQHCKEQQQSFFLFYLHSILQAVNQTEAMRYRIESGKVIDYAAIHANATINRADHTFGFCQINFDTDFIKFTLRAKESMQKIKETSGLCLNEDTNRNDVIHFSAMPWISFTGLTHARHLDGKDSVPKISVGKCFQQDGKLMMPVATFVHHGLVDGYHVHQFLQGLEHLFNTEY
ncbi:chloramphenicol acetyltransferase [Undibacterium sp. RTI2.1]|uniref:chloramphenicol acetyltransferase n=1 Tax=unclassified Undibacterium TaxID=2630295 RepID=UPI002AB4F70A|nr:MULTISPECIES: chloramphenicol acetyltransferase [unclassified Undibacterium]MDY7536910.1 chloramphenicol acetyltransferase [Undibacterium sp. 5I1]MEB0031660.1 chloramphenicol acetyltransferase [Undibacterium sp. RTI2.1]MEB0117931.1 chloramphenicol acetyltransferase [Undibacterium sp. RTI2.2]MEB0230415.1 chloramphenicol acetyltransferase [Undibacterium sp. 10I3]MEB0258833.1 chloramphenicol acetyltransferase [Undibacterium sp. 5I1]